MLISNNFSSLNSNKALNYKKNVNSKDNSNNISQKKSMNNPSFGSGINPGWLLAAFAVTLGVLVFLNDKTNIISSKEKLLNRGKIKARKAVLKKQFLETNTEEAFEDKMARIEARAIKIKNIRDAKKEASKAVKKAAKLATA